MREEKSKKEEQKRERKKDTRRCLSVSLDYLKRFPDPPSLLSCKGFLLPTGQGKGRKMGQDVRTCIYIHTYTCKFCHMITYIHIHTYIYIHTLIYGRDSPVSKYIQIARGRGGLIDWEIGTDRH